MTDQPPAWKRPHQGEHRWPVALAIALAIALQFLTPQELAFDPKWVLPAVEVGLLLGLLVVNPFRIDRESAALRMMGIALVAAATLALLWSTGRLVLVLVRGPAEDPGKVLLSGGIIWFTNVIVFSVWYWLTDRGGPAARANARKITPEFLFPQMTTPELTHNEWRPLYVDYLYLAFTNSTAFSPTDTMPLARWAKLAMLVQSCVSFLIVILVIARAVNALN
ncbi:hypothetical protein RB614_31985 [Phytohabitans sp. ZYX-F-186]|uniref:DUF1345 domain-containing protein n=1 Tax=Phytohabitans maris TaxID=3071409 RepID=A0ABU0ZRN3_9ACTN|nr:hypothetical protein [Phytohabitans sp. ZYX-F-186]MDQ7909152.1 hypothetical protein [Phytohabitans sp. ZYX-F-186]